MSPHPKAITPTNPAPRRLPACPAPPRLFPKAPPKASSPQSAPPQTQGGPTTPSLFHPTACYFLSPLQRSQVTSLTTEAPALCRAEARAFLRPELQLVLCKQKPGPLHDLTAVSVGEQDVEECSRGRGNALQLHLKV